MGEITQIQASQTLPLSVEQLARRADFVIHGKVLTKTVLRSGRGEIYTRMVVQVQEVWKGPATNQIVLVQAGGTLGDAQAVALGQAEYAPGEEIVDFLVLNERGEGVSIGLGRGKATVREDAATGEKRLVSPPRDLAAPPGLNPAGTAPALHDVPAVVTLEDFKARVKGALR